MPDFLIGCFGWIVVVLFVLFVTISAGFIDNPFDDSKKQEHWNSDGIPAAAVAPVVASTPFFGNFDMHTIFAIGSFWFFAVVIAEFALLWWAITSNRGAVASVSFGAFLAFLQFLCGIDLFGIVTENPLRVLAIVAGYLMIGVCWSYFHFWWKLNTKAQEIKDGEEEWILNTLAQKIRNRASSSSSSVDERGKTRIDFNEAMRRAREEYDLVHKVMPIELEADWDQYVDSRMPKASQNKTMIVNDIVFWFISAISFFLSDFMAEIGTKIYNFCRKFYEAVAISAANKVKKRPVKQ